MSCRDDRQILSQSLLNKLIKVIRVKMRKDDGVDRWQVVNRECGIRQSRASHARTEVDVVTGLCDTGQPFD